VVDARVALAQYLSHEIAFKVIGLITVGAREKSGFSVPFTADGTCSVENIGDWSRTVLTGYLCHRLGKRFSWRNPFVPTFLTMVINGGLVEA